MRVSIGSEDEVILVANYGKQVFHHLRGMVVRYPILYQAMQKFPAVGFTPGKVFEVEGTFENIVLNTPIVDKSREANAFIDHYHSKRLVILELGIGSRNRLIKLPLMQLAALEPQATYITLNLAQELYFPDEIAYKSIGLVGDITVTLRDLRGELA